MGKVMAQMLAGAALAAACLPASGASAQDAASAAQVAAEGAMADAEVNAEAAWGIFAEDVTSEPLTAEQQARLPQAQRVLALVFPDGALTEAYRVADAAATNLGSDSEDTASYLIYDALGYPEDLIEIEPVKAAQAMDILQPGWRERIAQENARTAEAASGAIAALEPALRQALAEVYAIRFDETQLGDIEAFFATPTGAVFARQTLDIGSDPRILAVFYNPEYTAALMADLAAPAEPLAPLPYRSFASLAPQEQARLAALTGLDKERLAQAMAATAEFVADNASE